MAEDAWLNLPYARPSPSVFQAGWSGTGTRWGWQWGDGLDIHDPGGGWGGLDDHDPGAAGGAAEERRRVEGRAQPHPPAPTALTHSHSYSHLCHKCTPLLQPHLSRVPPPCYAHVHLCHGCLPFLQPPVSLGCHKCHPLLQPSVSRVPPPATATCVSVSRVHRSATATCVTGAPLCPPPPHTL